MMDDINVSTYDLAPLCSLCGGSFGKAWAPDSTGVQEDRHWSRFARGIRGNKSAYDPSVVPLTGRCIQNGRFLLPLGDDADVFLPLPMPLHRYELSMRGNGESTYAVHEVCWQLVLKRVDILNGQRVVPELLARWLFCLLSALPYSPRGGLITQNGYFGALDGRKRSILKLDISIEYPRQGQPGKDLEDADPALPFSNSLAWLKSSRDPFQMLPYEVLCCILPLLRSRDVCNCRLASRWFAIHSTPSALPPSFWSSRFSPDGEMGFLGISDLPQSTTDCYRLHRHYTRLLSTVPGGDGLRNKRRIGLSLEPFATSLATVYHVDHIQSQPLPVSLSDGEVLGQKVSCYKFPLHDKKLHFGARVHHVQKLALPNMARGSILQVSNMMFENRSYICGLRLSTTERSHDQVQNVGLTLPQSMTTIHLRPNASIIRIDVYLSLDGVHGLALRTRTSQGCETHFAGVTNTRAFNMAVATLQPHSDIRGLVIEFDTFKALSFQLKDSQPSHQPLAEPRLWNVTHQPPSSAKSASQLPIASSELSVHYYASFGGENGERLSTLIRLSVYLDGAAGIYGLAFFYDDGSEVLYGSKTTTHELGKTIPCIEESFIVNGLEGERITKLAYLTAVSPHTDHKCIISLEVATQFNRRHVFRGYDREGFDQNLSVFAVAPVILDRVIVPAPQDCCLDALILRFTAPLFCLSAVQTGHSILLQCKEISPPQTSFDSKISQDVVDYAPWMTRKTGASFTSASLSGVRRIRVSTRQPNPACNTQYISGLWIDYFDKPSSSIVGQWSNEVGSITLQPDEVLVGMNILGMEITKRAESSAWQDFRLAWKGIRVESLKLQTSRGKTYDFIGDFKQDHTFKEVQLTYRATPYEEMGSIIWASNFEADDIQVRLKRSESLGSGNLLLCEAAYRIRHPCLSMHETRCFFNYDNADPEPLNPLNKTGVYGAMRRYYHASETFLWHERRADNGELVRLRQIEISFDRMTDGVRGLRCTYDTDFKKEFGILTGDAYILDLSHRPDEKVTLLVTRRIADGNYGIELHTDAGQMCRAMPDDKEDYEVDSYALVRAAMPPRISGATQWKKTHWGFPDASPAGQAISHCAGFWVSGPRIKRLDAKGFGEGSLDAIGPIYVTNPDHKLKPSLRLGLKEKIYNAAHGGGWTFR